MAIEDTLKNIEDVKSIRYDDKDNRFGEVICKKEFAKIKPPFDLVLRFKIDGKRHYHRMTFKGRTFAKAIEEARAQLTIIKRDGVPEVKKLPTYEKLLEEYLNIKSKAIAENSLKTYRSITKNYLQHIVNKRIDKIKPEHIQQAINDALDAGRAPRTAKAVQDYSRPVFNYAVGKGYIDKNPAANVKIPKFDNKRYFEIDEESARRLYKAILEYEEPLYRSIFIWLLHGRRLNEVLSLQWQHINFEAGTYEIVAANNKARRNKVYPLTPLQIEALPKPHRRLGLVFVGKNGGKIDRVSFRRRHWKQITNRAGIMGMRLHDLRHLFGYLAVNVLELPIEAVAEVLGHTSTQVTQRYANVGIKTVESATAKFFELLEGGEQ